MNKASFFIWFVVLSSHPIFAQEVESDISVRFVTKDSACHLQVVNLTHAPIHFIQKQKSTDVELADWVIQALDSLVLLTVYALKRDSVLEAIKSTYSFNYFIGDPAAIHDDAYLYRLPFKSGKAYTVSQGFNGSISHNTLISCFAIDFSMPIGEAVHAAREGLVVKVEDWFKEYGGEEYRFKANRIIVLHDDGTTASYVHLDYNGSLVREGDFVQRGQHIGYAGMTGNTNGPHLHFVVRKGRDLAVPIKFEDYAEQALRKGRKYKAKTD